MAEQMIYDSGNHSRKPRNSDPLPLRAADAVMTVMTVALAVTGVLTLMVPYVKPARLGVLPVLAVVAPIVYVGVIVTMLYWIMRWRWRRAGVMIALAVAGLAYVPRYFNPQLRRVYDQPTYQRSALKVMSYNLRCFFPDSKNPDFTYDSIADFVLRFSPDVICFQEYLHRNNMAQHRFDSMMGDYRKAVLENIDSPIAIYSRYRIADWGRVAYLDADSVKRGKAMWADIVVGHDTLRVFNVHLNSTSIKSDEADYIVNYKYMSDSARNTKLLGMVRRLNENTVNRSYHVDELAAMMRATTHATILCGDFNDTPMSYAYQTLAHSMTDAFRECGQGYSHTYRGFFDLLRIDYALFDSERFDVLSYEVPDSICWSDHLPVCVRAQLIDNR